MGIVISWLSANWFTLLQTLGIVSGLAFTAYNLMVNSRIRKIDTLINLTQQHRSIWLKFLDSPRLKPILSETRDLRKHPVRDEEMIFINLIILHLATALAAERSGVFPKFAGQDSDVAEFFSLPAPKAVWQKTKAFRDPEMIRYVDSLLTKSSNLAG